MQLKSSCAMFMIYVVSCRWFDNYETVSGADVELYYGMNGGTFSPDIKRHPRYQSFFAPFVLVDET